MILAFDTYYFGNKAKTVCLAFNSWTETTDVKVFSEITENNADYIPGEFYKRELPCILSLLEKVNEKVEVIIVDGYVYLDDQEKLGLGGHLYHELEQKISVIGVGKTNFATIDKLKRSVCRGSSTRPLYITAIGMETDRAADLIKTMDGAFRIPTLLKRLDTLTREKESN